MKRTSTTKSPRSLDIELHEARVFPLFTLAMPASEWCVFLIVSALFVFGIWLTIGEVRNWFNRRAELSRRPPSGMFKLLNSIFRHSSERPPLQPSPSETENRTAAVADVTPEKAA